MKILVTGSGGFLGKALTSHLQTSHTVIPFDIQQGDNICDPQKLKAMMKGIEIVVHCAALVNHENSPKRNFSEYFQTNCEGTKCIAEAAVVARVQKLIYISSTSAIGLEKGIPVKLPLSEKSLYAMQYLQPKQVTATPDDFAYSQTKAIAEIILAYFAFLQQIQVAIFRFPVIRNKENRPFLEHQIELATAVEKIKKAIDPKKQEWFSIQ